MNIDKYLVVLSILCEGLVNLFDVENLRKDFPVLETGVVYLDNASSTLTPEPVLQKMLEFYHEYRANVGRGAYEFSRKSTFEYDQARKKVAKFINARSEEEIIFTRNTTEGINIVANGLKWQKNDKVVTTLMEHHSNFIVWLRLKQRHGVKVNVVNSKEIIENGVLDPLEFEKIIDDNTKVVALTHISNVFGEIEPVEKITQIAHEHGAYTVIDAAQSVPHIKVDVQKIGCDFMAFSGHKMCAPTGCGVLYIRKELVDQVEPSYIGGGTIADVDIGSYTLDKGPAKFEAGTPAIAEALGMGTAVEYLNKIGINKIEDYERKLTRELYKGFEQINGVTTYGSDPKNKIALICFNINDFAPRDVSVELDKLAKIMVRAGHHCALPLIKCIAGKTGTVRASAYFYNTKEEIELLLQTVEEIAKRSPSTK
jgi:cysteine desulfurase/selenocysteine lyase